MIGFATIGTNFVVEWFLEAAKQCPELRYLLAYSRRRETAQAFAQKHGAEGFCTELEEIAGNDKVSAVYIASPNSLHFEQARLLLEAGKHVLCEKTITSNTRELEILLTLAREKGVTILEAMRPVFDPGFALIGETLSKLGKIRRVTFQYGKYSSRYDRFKQGVVENAFNPAFSNGALTDIGVYCIHSLVRLFGMPKRVLADGILLDNGVDGAGTILASYEGMQAELLYSKISDNRIPSQIQGEEGTLVIHELPSPCKIEYYKRQGEKEVLWLRENRMNMEYEAQEWARVIRGEVSPEAYNRCSLMEMEIIDEVKRLLGIVFPADCNGKA